MCRSRFIRSIVLYLIMISIVLSSIAGLTVTAAEKSGSCGQNLSWSFSAGTLTISGKGEMQNYNERNSAPWSKFSENIISVRLPEGLTTIGSFAFYNCTALSAISIPDNVQIISEKAFYNCVSLRLADLPNNLKSIGRSAFYNCEKLESVTLPDRLETISDKSFYLCRSIKSVVIPQSVKSIGKQTFAYCESLLRVEINAQITEIPEWCFYGCESLTQIELPEMVTQIGTYAFKRCDELYTVYHNGEKSTVNSVRNQIADDVPNFKDKGYISSGNLEDKTYTSDIETDENGALINQTNTSVQLQDGVTLVVSVTTSKDTAGLAHYTAYITLTVAADEYWDEAVVAVKATLSEINDTYSINHKLDGIKLTLYLKNTHSVNQYFLKELAGRKMVMEVVDANGSVWCVDCSELNADELNKDAGVSYTVTEPDAETNEALGTDNCYKVSFDQSSDIKTNLVIQLPDSAANTNAFLYQIESSGEHTRLQASLVDGDGNARFYVSSIDKDTEYIIGINVPNESIEDVIIPDEAADPFGAIFRLEKIEYVATGQRRVAGLTFGEIIIILFAALIVIAIIVGLIMRMKYKKLSLESYTNKGSENIKNKSAKKEG